MYREWDEADTSLANVLRRAGFGRSHGKKLIGLIVAFTLSVGIGISGSPAALASDTSTPATSTESVSSSTDATDATSTETVTSTESTSTEATSTEATSTASTGSEVTAPSIDSVGITGIARVGQVLGASVVASGSPVPTLSYQWESASSVDGSYASIAGATSDSYEITESELSMFIRLSVTAENESGSAGPVNSVPTIQVRGESSFEITALGDGVQITVISGDNQSRIEGSALTTPIVLQVDDATSSPVDGESVTAAVATGGGSLGVTTFTSDVNGQITIPAGTWTLGGYANTLDVYIANTSTNVAVSAVGLVATSIAYFAVPPATSAVVGEVVGSSIVTVLDQNATVLEGATVTFAASGGGGDGTIVNPTAVTDNNGEARSGNWRLGTQAGTNTLSAYLSGTTTFVTIDREGIPLPASVISVVPGADTSATVGTALASDVVFIVTDSLTNPISGQTVTFGSSVGSSVDTVSAVSDVNGTVTVPTGSWTLSTTASNNFLYAYLNGTAASTTFTAAANPDLAVTISLNINSGTSTVGYSQSGVVTVVDQYGNDVPNQTVTFAIAGGSGAAVSPASADSDFAGQVPVTFTMGNTPGTYTLSAFIENTSTAVTVTFVAAEDTASSITTAIAQDRGSATVGTSVGALSVTVTDELGNPINGFSVTFAATGGGGSGLVGPAASIVVVTTNTEGVASISSWTLGSVAGTNNVIATGEGSVGSVTFTAVGTVDQASQITVVSGQNESATVGTSVQVPLVVLVQDALNNSVSGATVTAAVVTGGGTISVTTAVTDENGSATFASGVWTLGTTSGINNNTVEVFLSGTSTSVTFTASGNVDIASQILPATPTNLGSSTVATSVGPISVTVLDTYGNPILNASVTIALSGGGGDGTSSVTSVLTDSNGFASFATWNLGTTVGTNTAVVNLEGTGNSVTFTAVGTQGAPSSFIQAIPQDRGSATVGTSVGALSVTVFDQYGNTVSGATVTFAMSGPYIGELSATLVISNSQGLASVNSWTLGNITGGNVVDISVTGANFLTGFEAIGTPDIADAIEVASNEFSSATLGTAVQVPLTVTVSDRYGNTVSGATVTYVVVSGDGALSVTSADSVSGGIATLPSGVWTLSTTVGTNNNTLQAYLSGTSTFVTFTASSSPDLANRVVAAVDTDRGSSTVATGVGALSVTVFDRYSNTISGATVTIVVSGSGIASPLSALSDSSGVATFTSWTLSTTAGTNTAVIYLAGTSTGVTFTATGTTDIPALVSIASGSGQSAEVTSAVANPITVLVTDQHFNIVNAASVTYAVSGGGGSVGGSGTLTTSADGTATLAGSTWQLGEIVGVNSLAFYVANTPTFATATATGNASTVSLANSLLTSAPTSIVANGTSTSVISLQLRDTYGNNVTTPLNAGVIDITFNPIAGWEASSVWTLVSQGLYQRVLQANTQTGLVTLQGTVSGVTINDTATVALTVGPPSRIVVVSGENQTTTVGTNVPNSLLVNVYDAQDRLLDGITVTYAVLSGDGSIAGSSTQTVNGLATLGAWTLGQTAGINTVVAVVSGTSLQQTFTATGTVDVPALLNVVSGASQTGVVNNLVPDALVVNVTDQYGNALNGVSVTYAVVGQGSIVGSSDNSDVNGTVTLGAWTLGSLAGTNTVVAYINGTATGVTFTAISELPLLTIGSGQGQTAVVNTSLSNPLTVLVTDQNGNPVNGQSLTYAVTGGGGSIAGSPITSVNGTATLGAWTLGTTAGTNNVVVYVAGTSVSATFTATGEPDTSLIEIATGQGQTSTVNTIPTVPLSVTIIDTYGNLITGQTVTYAVTGGGGSVVGTTAASVGGIATIGNWTLGQTAGTNTVVVYINGTGSFVTFVATGVHDIPANLNLASGNGQEQVVNTALTGPLSVTVTDQFGNAVSNATVTFGVTGGGGSLSATSADSDSSGIATLPASNWTLGTTAGINTVIAYLNGTTAAVTFTASGVADTADPANSLITANPTANSANGTATSVVSLQLRDIYGNVVTSNVSITTVTFASSQGVWPSPAYYEGNGVYKRVLQAPPTSSQSVTAILTARVNDVPVVSTASVAFITPVFTIGNSSLSANPTVITADGTSTSVISVQLRDQFGNNLNNFVVAPSVTLSANEGSLLGSMQNMGNGLYQQVLEASLLTVTSVIGAFANGSPISGNAQVYFAPGPATIIGIINGNGQTSTVGTAVSDPLTVTVSDSYGHLLNNTTVTFAVVSGGQTTFTSVQTVNGTATLGTWTLSTVPGGNTLEVFIADTSTGVSFTATAVAGAPAILAITGGNNQSARVSTNLALPLTVTVSDEYGNLLTDATVTFAVTLGGGSLSSLSVTTVGGTATINSWLLGSVVGTQNAQAFISGTSTGVTFAATGTAIPTPPAPPAPAPEPDPVVTPTPTPVPTPAPAPIPTLDWNPVGATVGPNGSIAQFGGVNEQVTVVPNSSKDGLVARGTQWGVNVQGVEFGGGTAPLLGGTILVVQAGQQVLVSGFGYQPNSVVKVFGYSPVILLGEVSVNAQGAFEASLLVPLSMQVGNGTLQVNGYAPNGLVRSTSIGLEVRKAAMQDGTQVITKVFFASRSSELTARDQRRLTAFLAEVPKGAIVSTLFAGFAGPNAKDDAKATGISRLRATNTAEYMRSIGLRGDVYTSGQGRSKVSGENGRKVVVTLTYKVMRSTDFEVGELKQMLLG